MPDAHGQYDLARCGLRHLMGSFDPVFQEKTGSYIHVPGFVTLSPVMKVPPAVEWANRSAGFLFRASPLS